MPDSQVADEKLLAERTALIEEMKRIEKRVWTINLKLAEQRAAAKNEKSPATATAAGRVQGGNVQERIT